MKIVDFGLIEKEPLSLKIGEKNFNIKINYGTSLRLIKAQQEVSEITDPLKSMELMFNFVFDLLKKSDANLKKEWLEDNWQIEYFTYLFNHINGIQNQIDENINGKQPSSGLTEKKD